MVLEDDRKDGVLTMSDNPTVICVSDIVMEDGRTWRDQNLEDLHHGIPLDTLVEVQYDSWFGDGACEKVHARLYVVEHTRDCDGTPLYSLCQYTRSEMQDIFGVYFAKHGSVQNPSDLNAGQKGILNIRHGFSEESLTPVKVTEDLKKGYDGLQWDDE